MLSLYVTKAKKVGIFIEKAKQTNKKQYTNIVTLFLGICFIFNNES